MPSKCRNGPACPYLARGICKFRHPGDWERDREETERLAAERRAVAAFKMVATRMQKEEMKRLFDLMDPAVQVASCIKLAEDEILRRIGSSDEKECLKVLQETVARGEERFNHLEENAMKVMTRSYSYFCETIWNPYAYEELSFEAFKKLASAAKKAKTSWDTSRYSGYTDSDDSTSESEYGQLSDMQEEFKAILVWVEREDVEQSRRDLVMAVFKTGVRKSRASVIRWMKSKIAAWDKKEREEEEEMKRIEDEVKRDIELGIPFTSGIPGRKGRKLDAQINDLRDLGKIRNPLIREAVFEQIIDQMKEDESDSEDEEEYFEFLGMQLLANELRLMM